MNNNTRHTLAVAVLAAAGFFAAGFAQAAGPSLAGIWMLEGDFSTLKTSDGKLPPLKPEARRAYQAALAARKAGKPGRLMIDATHLKAHRTAASLLKKGLFPDVSGAQRAA